MRKKLAPQLLALCCHLLSCLVRTLALVQLLCRLPLTALPGCISAANGVGCILAELGNMTAAKEVFLQVCAPC